MEILKHKCMQPQQNPKYQACKSLKELLLHNTAREKSPSVTVTSLEYVLSNSSVAPAHEAFGRIPTQKENRLEHISCRVMVTLPAENQTDSTLFNVSEKCPSEFKTNPRMYLSSFCLPRTTFRLAVLNCASLVLVRIGCLGSHQWKPRSEGRPLGKIYIYTKSKMIILTRKLKLCF